MNKYIYLTTFFKEYVYLLSKKFRSSSSYDVAWINAEMLLRAINLRVNVQVAKPDSMRNRIKEISISRRSDVNCFTHFKEPSWRWKCREVVIISNAFVIVKFFSIKKQLFSENIFVCSCVSIVMIIQRLPLSLPGAFIILPWWRQFGKVNFTNE